MPTAESNPRLGMSFIDREVEQAEDFPQKQRQIQSEMTWTWITQQSKKQKRSSTLWLFV